MNMAIYTNILTPYRTYFYDLMYNECKKNGDNFYVILMAETEPNRNWKYEQFKTDYTILLESKTVAMGETYIHFNKNLKSILQGLQLDVLICAGGYLCPGIWSALSWRKKFGYKVLFWSESHLNEARNYGGMKVKLRESIRNAIYKKFDGFWYAGEMSRQFIETYATQEKEMHFMPNLVEEEKYKKAALVTEEEKEKLREKYSVSSDKTVFVCPARLSTVKGMDKFTELFAKAKNNKKATVLVAGDGELKEALEKDIQEKDVDIRLLGFQNQESVIELYSIADVFLLPSLSDPNPLTCIEALWSGLPLFISEHCGNYPEVVRQGENGYVFSYTDAERAVEYLEKIIDSDASWRNGAKEISQHIANEKYDSKKVVREIVKE